MKNLVVGLVFGALSIAATQALAQQTQGKPQPRPAAVVPNPDQVTCREVEETGSRIARHKLCGTRAQWAQRLLDDREKTEDIQMVSMQRDH